MDDICGAIDYTKNGEAYSTRIMPVLKRHFEQFEKDIIANLQKELDEAMWGTTPEYRAAHTGFTPICPGIADKATKVATFKPAGQSLLEALRAGAENPVVSGDVCPVCANGTDICSYCARNFEGVEND
jgi:hypothetical protein